MLVGHEESLPDFLVKAVGHLADHANNNVARGRTRSTSIRHDCHVSCLHFLG
jgi:hypothetical protein